MRWAFLPELGFPWHGFYLFRRPARAGTPLCLRSVIGGLKKGNWPENKHYTALGVISSDKNLVLTDDFTPPNQVEFALDGRTNLRFDLPAGELARRVELRIGFRQERCLDLEKLIPGDARPVEETARAAASLLGVVGPNPLVAPGVSFAVKNPDGTLLLNTQFGSVNSTEGPLTGLHCVFAMTIKLSEASDFVELLLSLTSTLPGTGAGVKVDGFDSEDKLVATAQMLGPQNQPKTITLTGKNILRVEVRTNGLNLYRICFDKLSDAAPRAVTNAEVVDQAKLVSNAEVKITAFSGSTPVRSLTITGQEGQIQSATIEADAISAIEIGPGPGSLVDLCYVPVAQDATQGWEKLSPFTFTHHGLTYPIGLPVTHPNYPCSIPDPRPLLPNRVSYKLPPGWEILPPDFDPPNFIVLRDQLVALVKGGPNGEPMADRILKPPPEQSTPPDPNPPNFGRFYVLDLILLGALHPGLAQLLGLYWVDQNVEEKVAYDYLIMADHTGVGQRDPDKVLAFIQANGFAQLDGYIVFNKRLEDVPPLPEPTGLETLELPGGTFPDAQGLLPQACNNAGLRWDLGGEGSDSLPPDSAVMYLVWRTYLGDGATPMPIGLQVLVTKSLPDDPKPLLVTEARLPNGLPPERSPEWPAVPHFIDRNLGDGWYSYQVNGIDMFGRHSLNSAPSQLLLRDNIPPPMPTAVEAYALDPEDRFLQKDAAYKNWLTSLSPASLQKTLVGLRVRWIWTRAHQQQALDTREFRIYFHPGSDLPSAHDLANNWQDRFQVVAYNEFFSSINPTSQNFLATGGVNSVSITAPSGVKWLAVSSDPTWIAIISGSSGSGDGTVTYFVASNPGTPRTGTLKIAGHTFIINQQDASSAQPVSPAAGALEDRVYEVFLPLASATTPVGLPLNPSLANPVVYAHIGISAADDKPHAADQRTTGNFSNRPGNEGRVGPPARIYRVWRTPPPAPEDVIKGERLYASPADYYSRSFFTYRWKPRTNLDLHVFRAMDEGVFKADWAQRPSTLPLSESELALFPAGWNQATRQQIADELNHLNSFVPVKDRTTEAMAYYRQLSDAALRVLAGMGSAESAFVQLTINALKDTENLNRRGPDNPDDLVLDLNQRAFVDTLDGGSTNRYFYRAAFVDGAHNLGPLGLSSPPVYLPNVVPPRAPVITKVLGGDRAITLKWASNREPDLAEYRVYRADNVEATRDLRLMTLVHTERVPPGDPSTRPAEVIWADTGLIGGQILFHRITAVDSAGNVSAPSGLVSMRVVDTAIPTIPKWIEAKWVLLRDNDQGEDPWPQDGVIPTGSRSVVRLVWSSSVVEPMFILSRSLADQWSFRAISIDPHSIGSLQYLVHDSNALASEAYHYQVSVISSAGVPSRKPTTVRVKRP